MERQRRQQQEAAAAAALHGALVCLNRGGACKEPLAPGMFARPNPKGMQAVLHLLYIRIRGPARAKKELQHVYPVLEPAQGREFKAAMQAWIKELGAAGALLPDTVKYFVTAYQGSNSHRTVLMLLDLSALALSKELGEGPHTSLPNADLLQPHGSCGSTTGPSRRALQAAAPAQREGQARMDEVVAAMQRIKQLQTQAVAHLAAGRGGAGAAAASLGPLVPPLFAASQASCRRGELVQELLANGPVLTAKPEAVGPDSWADLLAAGKGAAAAAAAASSQPLTARRLSDPGEEASSFAAEGLAADADVLTVQSVLVHRLAATNKALTTVSSTDVRTMRTVLAEAAAYRESLMLSVRHELAAAGVRADQQARPANAAWPSMLQLLPPSRPPCNPVSEGMQAAQHAATEAEAVGNADDSRGWAPPQEGAVQALRFAMWHQLQNRQNSISASGEPFQAVAAASPSHALPTADTPVALPASPSCSGAATAAGSSSSKAPRAVAATSRGSPSLADLLSQGDRLDAVSLLSELPGPAWDTPEPLARQRAAPQQHGPLPLDSPCMAESCASASVAGDSRGRGSSGAGASAAGAGRQHASSGGTLAVSPMLSAAASFMPHRQRPIQQQHLKHQHGGSQLLAAATVQHGGRPAIGATEGSSGQSQGSPAAGSVPWRRAAAEEAAAADASSPMLSARRRPGKVAFTLTPPRRLGDSSPEGQQLSHSSGSTGSPSPQQLHANEDATPVSKMYSGRHGSTAQQADGAASAHVLQQRQQPASSSSPGSPLLASCLKSRPAAVPVLPVQAVQQQPQQQESPRWALAAGRSSPALTPAGGGQLSSPRSGDGLRRSAIITTHSPRRSNRVTEPSPAQLHCLASGGSAGTPAPAVAAAADKLAAAAQEDDLLGPPKALNTPFSHSLFSAGTAAAADTPGAVSRLNFASGPGDLTPSVAQKSAGSSTMRKMFQKFNSIMKRK